MSFHKPKRLTLDKLRYNPPVARFALAVAVLLLAACGGGGSPTAPTPDPGTAITFVNLTDLGFDVQLKDGEAWNRLGSLAPQSRFVWHGAQPGGRYTFRLVSLRGNEIITLNTGAVVEVT